MWDGDDFSTARPRARWAKKPARLPDGLGSARPTASAHPAARPTAGWFDGSAARRPPDRRKPDGPAARTAGRRPGQTDARTPIVDVRISFSTGDKSTVLRRGARGRAEMASAMQARAVETHAWALASCCVLPFRSRCPRLTGAPRHVFAQGMPSDGSAANLGLRAWREQCVVRPGGLERALVRSGRCTPSAVTLERHPLRASGPPAPCGRCSLAPEGTGLRSEAMAR